MTAIELQQLCKNLAFLGTDNSLSSNEAYVSAATQLNEQIDHYMTPGESGTLPVFDNQALGDLLESVSKLRRSLSGITDRKTQIVLNAEEQLGMLENLFSQVDVTKGWSLTDSIDELNHSTVKVGGEMEHVGGQASSRGMINIPTAGGQSVNGFFTEEKKLLESHPALEQVFYTAKAAHSNDPEFQNFCERVLGSPYGLRTLELSFDATFSDSLYERTDDDEIASRAFRPDILANYGIIDDQSQFDDLLKNQNVSDLFREMRRITSDDYVTNATNEHVRYGADLNDGLKAAAGSSMTGRNVAMSRVANLLGISDIVARSRTVSLESDGETVQGVFMEQAHGLDYPGPDKIRNSPFIDLAEDAFDGEGLESVSGTGILDWICQNVDRHQNNMLYNIDENGKLKNVMGIDHDMSFGTAELDDNDRLQNGTTFNDIGVISEPTANAVRRMTPEMLTNALSDTGLKPAEIKAACKRLEKLQKALETATYMKPGEKIESGKIKIVPKEQWKDMKLQDLKSTSGRRNVFSMVDLVASQVKEKQKERAKEKKQPSSAAQTEAKQEKTFAKSEKVDELDPNHLHEYQESIRKLNADLKKTEGLFHGSNQQYKAMRSALDAMEKFSIDTSRPMTDAERTAYYTHLSDLSEKVQGYIDYKTPRGDTGKTAEARLSTANELKKLVVPHLDNFRDAWHDQQEKDMAADYREYKKEDNKYAAIVDSLAETICAKGDNAVLENVKHIVKYSGVLKEMVKGSEDLEALYKLSKEQPEELYMRYGKALSKAHPAAQNSQNNANPAINPVQRTGRQSGPLQGGEQKSMAQKI